MLAEETATAADVHIEMVKMEKTEADESKALEEPHDKQDLVENAPRAREHTLRVAGLLALYSLVLLVEGLNRFVLSDPTAEYHDLKGKKDKVFPPIVLILGAVFEVFFAFAGLFVGLGALAFDFGHAAITFWCLTSQLVLGVFTFAVYVFALPIWNNRNHVQPPVYPANTLDEVQRRLAVSWGYVICSFTFCFCAQGFAFYTALQLYWIQKNRRETSAFYNIPRLVGYSFLMLIAGLGMLYLGGLVYHKSGVKLVGKGTSGDLYGYPPNIVEYANLTITSGVLLVVYAFLGFTCAVRRGLSRWMVIYAVCVWLYLITGHVMTQTAYAGSSFAAAAETIGVLATATMIAPAYFAHRSDHPDPKTQA